MRTIGHLLSDPGASFRDPGPEFYATRIGPEHANAGTSATWKPLGYKVHSRTRRLTSHITFRPADAPGGLRAAGRR